MENPSLVEERSINFPGSSATSTVNRGRPALTLRPDVPLTWKRDSVKLQCANSLDCYAQWESPKVILSDGAYGILGFEGDTADHLGLVEWYEPHVRAWTAAARPDTTLWFWNSEIGWAVVHPLLERLGWRYVNTNIWNKGKAHIAGNVNTAKIRRFPVVSEVCVQYVFEPKISGLSLKKWLLHEWRRTGLPLREANTACGVADAAVRKYLDQGHLWYFPPGPKFAAMAAYANEYGAAAGRPYFSTDGQQSLTAAQWERMRSTFNCPHGITNVWDRPPLRGEERVTVGNGKAVHLNQKPLDLLTMLIRATTEPGDLVWEPFGGMFSGCLAAVLADRQAVGAEIDETYYQYGVQRLTQQVDSRQHQLF